MKTTTILLLLILLLIGNACGNHSDDKKIPVLSAEYDSESSLNSKSGNQATPKLKSEKPKSVYKQMIIKNGDLSIETENIDKSKGSLNTLVSSLDAYYENEVLVNDNSSIHYNIDIRIPARNFEKLIRGIESGGDKITNKTITADDVSEEYYDLETRLSSKRAYLKRYQELVYKANTIPEILNIEEKIRELEEEIESAEGRMRFLADQVGYSTLHLSLVQKKEIQFQADNSNSFSTRFKNAFRSGWSGIVNLFIGLLTLWPLIIMAGTTWYFIRRYKKRNKSSNPNAG